ncbi:hypothetical protein FI667_g14635, partial [Globisporangium splendens]
MKGFGWHDRTDSHHFLGLRRAQQKRISAHTMDVILSRLDPRQLRVYCSDALQQELKKTSELLEQAIAAAKRAEEVQLASHKLAIQEFQRDARLLEQLEQIDSLRLQFSISIDHIMRGARGELQHTAMQQQPFFPGVKDEGSVPIELESGSPPYAVVNPFVDTNNIIDLSAAQESAAHSAASSSKKRKLSVTSSAEQQPAVSPAPSSISTSAAKKFVLELKQIASQGRLGKSIHAAIDYANDIMKRKTCDRIQSFPTLSNRVTVVVKNIEDAEYAEVGEAMEPLNHLISVAVTVLVKAKPNVKRHVATKMLKMIQEVQIKFPGFANLFEKSYASLSKYIDMTFPLTVRETDELRRRLRATLKEINAWEVGSYSVPDFNDKMKIVKHALDCNCEGWNAHTDATVLELLDMLILSLNGFKDSQAQEKRKETLQAWRAEMKVTNPIKSKPSSDSKKSSDRSQSKQSPSNTKQPEAKKQKAEASSGAAKPASKSASSKQLDPKAAASSKPSGANNPTQNTEPKKSTADAGQKGPSSATSKRSLGI